MNYDVSYGSVLSATPPLNAVQLPFVPIMFVLRYDTELLNQINEYLMLL